MEKIKRRRFVKDMMCWSTALVAAGWLNVPSADPKTDPKPDPTPKKIPEPDVQPCYGVAPPPKPNP